MEICAETGRIYGILTSRNTVGKDEKLRNGIAFKSIAGIVALLIVFSVIVSIIGYVEFTDALMQQCAGGAFYTADASALTVKADHLQMYPDSGGTDRAQCAQGGGQLHRRGRTI